MGLRGFVAAALLLVCGGAAMAQSPQDAGRCANCEAIVQLNAGPGVQLFVDALLMLNSMPLHGQVINYGNATTTVVVATQPDYAARNGLDSFDVAHKVVGFAADARYGIRRVEATWSAPSPENVGTIGHGVN